MTRILIGALIVVVAVVSSAATTYLLMRNENVAVLPQPVMFEKLNVIDSSRHVLSFDEQQALFTGFTDKLTDPVSAQYRNLVRMPNKPAVCGEVNGKNKFGGYVGFAPFMAVFTGPTTYIVVLSWDTGPEKIKDIMRRTGCDI